MYAFTTSPLRVMSKEELGAQPPNTTLCPYAARAPSTGPKANPALDSKKRSFEEMEKQDRMAPAAGRIHRIKKKKKRKQKKKKKKKTTPQNVCPSLPVSQTYINKVIVGNLKNTIQTSAKSVTKQTINNSEPPVRSIRS